MSGYEGRVSAGLIRSLLCEQLHRLSSLRPIRLHSPAIAHDLSLTISGLYKRKVQVIWMKKERFGLTSAHHFFKCCVLTVSLFS